MVALKKIICNAISIAVRVAWYAIGGLQLIYLAVPEHWLLLSFPLDSLAVTGRWFSSARSAVSTACVARVPLASVLAMDDFHSFFDLRADDYPRRVTSSGEMTIGTMISFGNMYLLSQQDSQMLRRTRGGRVSLWRCGKISIGISLFLGERWLADACFADQ